MRKIIFAVMAIALFATVGVAMAQGWGRGSGWGYGGYGPCASGYGPASYSNWCPRFNVTPDQAQRGLPPEQQERLNSSRGGYQNYGPGYGMRGGTGYGRRGGMGYGSGYGW